MGTLAAGLAFIVPVPGLLCPVAVAELSPVLALSLCPAVCLSSVLTLPPWLWVSPGLPWLGVPGRIPGICRRNESRGTGSQSTA